MSARDHLHGMVDLLSEYESQHLLRLVDGVVAGERFWEGDVAIFYNEYVKMRSLNVSRNPASFVSTAPIQQEGIFAPIPLIKTYPTADRVLLPPPNHLQEGLSDVIVRRRSKRSYQDRPISVEQLATLLQHAAGITGSVAAYDFNRLPLRTFPSAGGLQAPELYCFARTVESVPPGLYHYHSIDHVLESLGSGDGWTTVCEAVPGQPYIATSAVAFIVTGYYERLRWKYGPRAYRYICMDAGFLAQNLHLAGEALGLGVCAVAGFLDDLLEGLLGINGEDELALLLATVGYTEPESNIENRLAQ
jgi:SagB-type dehydrogenase family enzyme